MAVLSRHGVLVTQPLSAAARLRLETFFDVQTLSTAGLPARDELAELLHDKAGVLTGSRVVIDADLIARLPRLRAVCHAGPGLHAFDLDACTRAGIRATSLPMRASAGGAAGGSYRRWSRGRLAFSSLQDADAQDPSRVAAEDLVAALGFGRHGWHPPNLLNTEILCESCC